jgi:hypothetical protein
MVPRLTAFAGHKVTLGRAASAPTSLFCRPSLSKLLRHAVAARSLVVD